MQLFDTDADVIFLLTLKLNTDWGKQAALAHEIGIAESTLSAVLHGKIAPGPKILAFLGLQKVRAYTYAEAE